jgi:hypothetical protein
VAVRHQGGRPLHGEHPLHLRRGLVHRGFPHRRSIAPPPDAGGGTGVREGLLPPECHRAQLRCSGDVESRVEVSVSGVSRQVRVEGIEARQSGARPVGRSRGAARCMRERVWAAQVQLCRREAVARQVSGVGRQVRIAA